MTLIILTFQQEKILYNDTFTGVEYNGTRVPCHSKNKFFILYKEQTLIIYFGILTGLVSACLKSTSGVFEVIMAEEESENNLEENNLSQPGSSKLDF